MTPLPPEAIVALHTKLETDSASVQKACAEALGQASTITPLPPKAILALQNQFETGSQADVRKMCAEVLGQVSMTTQIPPEVLAALQKGAAGEDMGAFRDDEVSEIRNVCKKALEQATSN